MSRLVTSLIVCALVVVATAAAVRARQAPGSAGGDDEIKTIAGTFDITCSEYCGSGHAAMKGRLIVAAKTR
jgi:hypothetical protein